MSNTSRFDYCPKCGALARDGVCQSCGYVDKKRVSKVVEAAQPSQSRTGDYSYAKPQKGNKGTIVLLVILIVILMMLFICCSRLVAYLALDTEIGKENIETTMDTYKEDSESDASEDLSSKEEIDSEKILYYTGPYNDLRDDLLYQVEFKEEDFRPEDHIGKVRINVEYPQLTGAAPNLEVINSYLENEYWYYKQYFDERYEPNMDEYGNFYIASLGYVTYMDDEVMSVVFHEELNVDGQKVTQYYCLNFDMKDGVILNNLEILDIDISFVQDYRKRVSVQHASGWLVENTDQEILEYFLDWDNLVIYYTPMGMEVGLNLHDQVLTVTFSDYEKYLKK